MSDIRDNIIATFQAVHDDSRRNHRFDFANEAVRLPPKGRADFSVANGLVTASYKSRLSYLEEWKRYEPLIGTGEGDDGLPLKRIEG